MQFSQIGSAQAPRPGGSWLLPILALGFVMAMIDVTAVNVALPDISLTLCVPLTGLVWVVDGYTLTFAALLMAGGALADRFGSKRAYQMGLAVFTMASAMCALASSGPVLVSARLLQGIGAAMFMPSSLSLMTYIYPDERKRAHMLGLWSALVGAAASVGPFIGGVLVSQFGWRGVFWINVPLGMAGIVLAHCFIAQTPRILRFLSLVSHGYGVIILGSVSYLLIETPVLGWASSSIIVATAVAIVTTFLMVKRERTGLHPLLPAPLLASSSFKAATTVGFLINFCVFGLLFLLSLYFQESSGSSSLAAGAQLVPVMAASTVGNYLSGKITSKVGVRKPLLYGLFCVSVMSLVIAAFVGEHSHYTWLIGGIVIMYVPLGVAVPAMTTAVMQIAGRMHSNSAAAALNANRQIGALFGVAVIGSIMHVVSSWNQRLTIAFGIYVLAYGTASWLTYRYVDVSVSLAECVTDLSKEASR